MNTYSGDPSSSAKDAVRFHLGDTGPSWELTDEEINYVLTTSTGSPPLAAAKCARTLAAKYSSQISKQVGSLRIEYGSKYRQYLDLADSLERSARSVAAAPYAGGISKADIDTRRADTDQVVNDGFNIGMFDNPASVRPATWRDLEQ